MYGYPEVTPQLTRRAPAVRIFAEKKNTAPPKVSARSSARPQAAGRLATKRASKVSTAAPASLSGFGRKAVDLSPSIANAVTGCNIQNELLVKQVFYVFLEHK